MEVEHILEAASQRIDGLPDLLDELSNTEDWSDVSHLPDGKHVVPLARWALIASAYCRDGIPGLRAVLNRPNHESFVLALLEELHSSHAVDAIMDLFSQCIGSPGEDPFLAHKIASSLNLILCFKPEFEIDGAATEQIRAFATELIKISSEQVDRAVPVLLLRAVGDEGSLQLLDSLPEFTEHWASTIPATRRAIRNRLKKKKGQSGRGDGIAPVTPPTPPDMRVRIRRFQSDDGERP